MSQETSRAPLTDRVNTEPPILHGTSATEAKYIFVVSFGLSLIVGGALFAVTGFWHFLFGFAVFAPVLSLWFGSQYLQTLKRGRPDGYYGQAMHLWLVHKGYAKGRFIAHHHYWDLGRPLEFSLEAPFYPDPDPVSVPDSSQADAVALAPDRHPQP